MRVASVAREVRAGAESPVRLRAQVPRPSFTAAYRELCARIWIELEVLAQVEDEDRLPHDLVMATAILRLELVVLVDFCRSPRWHRILSAAERDSLCSMLTDVLAALYVDSEHLRSGIEAAQDRVFDELICLIEAPAA